MKKETVMTDNTQNTGSSKKKKIAASALAVALAAALLIGGTFSYLTASSDEVENDFSANYNKVTLTENNGAEEGEEVDYDFDIVPGTSETKDPTVTATYTLDSYVFLLVDDDTADLVEYDILTTDNGGVWTLLYSEDGENNPVDGYAVYYTTVTSSTADSTGAATDSEGNSYTYYTDTIKVIVGDDVYYPSTLTNDNMFDDDGNLIGGISLSFMAYIIQADPFNDLADNSNTDAKTALLAILGLYTQYDKDENTTLTAVVATTIASDSTTDSTSTTFTLTIPSATTIASESSSDDSSSDDTSSDSSDDSSTDDAEDTEDSSTPTSLTLSVTETTADTVAVVPDGDAGDYTYEISLVDQDGNSVSATSGYMNVAIQIKTGITASNLTVTKLGDESDTTLSTSASESNGDYYSYDSTTGVLTIYTQSLGEYEIYWNDTGLAISLLSGDSLSTSVSVQSTFWTMNYATGWQLSVGSSTNSDYSGWVVDYALTFDSDITEPSLQALCKDSSGNYYLANYCYGDDDDGSEIIAKDTTYLLFKDMFEITDTERITTTTISAITGTQMPIATDTKYLCGLLSAVVSGYTQSQSVSDFSADLELRLYEIENNAFTGKYIVLDTNTLSYSSSSD